MNPAKREQTPVNPRVRAAELTGRSWLNTGGRSYRMTDLRGRIVLLDFWTFCCINCLHVLDELRPLEEKYADVLVTVGVHSPKFAHEAEHASLVAAVQRYAVTHPVLDDPDLSTWRAYAVRAWPTLAVIDPEGYVVAQLSGEGHAHALDVLLAELVAIHDAKGTLRRGSGPYIPPPPSQEVLSFPSKALELPDGTLLVADSAHHSLARLTDDGENLLQRIGSGQRGLVDGTPGAARFNEPGGLLRLPAEVAERAGYDLLVADTVNHALRGVDSTTWTVRTVAGTGAQWMHGNPSAGPATEVALSSPWDLAWYDGGVVVAMAGVHRLDRFDPVEATMAPYAGTTQEGLLDGPVSDAWFAQPSGLCSGADRRTLWLVDAETSALRRVRHGVVDTVIGQGLFDFGHVDGPAGQALLQHPLGLAELADGSVVVADTYNGAIRRCDPFTGEVTTLATGLAEPSDVVVVAGEDGEPELLVVESAGHRVTRVVLPLNGKVLSGKVFQTQRPSTDVASGTVELEVVFTPPTGQKLDDRYGPAAQLVVSSTPPELLVAGAGTGTTLRRRLELADPAVSGVREGVLHVAARAASCDDPDAPGAAEFPACHVHQQDWGVPVRITGDGCTRLVLPLAGTPA